MPRTDVVFYRDDDGTVPARVWLGRRRDVPATAALKLLERVGRLRQLGRDLRRPESAPLRDGVYELRVRHLRVNYRLLYGFHDRPDPTEGETSAVAAVLLGLTKEDVVPPTEIDRAVRRLKRFRADPAGHSYTDEPPGPV